MCALLPQLVRGENEGVVSQKKKVSKPALKPLVCNVFTDMCVCKNTHMCLDFQISHFLLSLNRLESLVALPLGLRHPEHVVPRLRHSVRWRSAGVELDASSPTLVRVGSQSVPLCNKTHVQSSGLKPVTFV